jgi:hypothetical protein
MAQTQSSEMLFPLSASCRDLQASSLRSPELSRKPHAGRGGAVGRGLGKVHISPCMESVSAFAALGIVDHLRRRFARFKPGAHFLDL